MAYKVLILGASYGSLLATKLLFGGHTVKLVCLPAEAEAINKDGARVRLPADRAHGVSYDISFTANHPTMSIEKAQYSVDGGEWILLAPTSGITDNKTEKYTFTVKGLMPGEHTVAVRAYDRFENVGAGKTTFTVAGTKN